MHCKEEIKNIENKKHGIIYIYKIFKRIHDIHILIGKNEK